MYRARGCHVQGNLLILRGLRCFGGGDASRYGTDGAKQRYFQDDDKKDLDALVRQQRYEGAADIDANLARNIASKARYKVRERHWPYFASPFPPPQLSNGPHTMNN
jgi:hypothetical protein